MGCVCKPAKITIQLNKNPIGRKKPGLSIHTKNYQTKLSRNNWTHIINYLSYKDIREVGKISKYITI
jgi:hypothetical protein